MRTQRITEISVQKRRPKRRSIFIDGEFLCGVDREVVARLGLRVGQPVDKEEIQRILRQEDLTRARDYALKLLSYRPRTIKEIRDRLKLKDYDEDIVQEVIRNLKRLNLLNDREFALSWATNRMRLKPVGRFRLRQELLAKGIPEGLISETIEAAYQEADEVELASQVAGQKMRSYRNLNDLTSRRRMYAFLQRRGFSHEIIRETMRRVTEKRRERSKGKDDDWQ